MAQAMAERFPQQIMKRSGCWECADSSRDSRGLEKMWHGCGVLELFGIYYLSEKMYNQLYNYESNEKKRQLQDHNSAMDVLAHCAVSNEFLRNNSFLLDSSAGKSSMMVSLLPSHVPEYLYNSVFYKALDLESNDPFDVPIDSFKSDLTIATVADLDLLLNTLHFWGCEEVFTEVLHYVYNVVELQHVHTVCNAYTNRFRYMKVLQEIRPYFFSPPHGGRYFHVLNRVLPWGILEMLVFLRAQGLTFNQESVMYAIRSKSVECLRYVLEQGFVEEHIEQPIILRSPFVPTEQDTQLLRYCAQNALVDVLTIDASRMAAQVGDLELLQMVHALRCPWDNSICTLAAAAGHLDCLRFVHENGGPWDAETCVAAAKGKHIECLTYAMENGCPADERVSNFAIGNDDIEMLMFAHENLLPWEDDMCMLAAKKGSLRCLRYVHEAGCALTAETCSAAAWNYDISCLKYAHENGAPWDITTCINATRNNNFTAIEYAVARGCPVDSEVCTRAILRNCSLGHVLFMCQNNYPLHPDMCKVAARRGYEKQLQFLHEGGCPWNVSTTRDASRSGNLGALKYAAEHGCPVEVVPCSCSVEPDHFECMKYVYDNWDSTFNPIPAIIHDHHQCYMHAYNNGYEWTEAAVVCAARLGKLLFLQFAFKPYRCPFYRNIDNVYAAAVENGHSDCVAFLDMLKVQKQYGMHSKMVFHRKVRALARVARRRKVCNVDAHIANFLHTVLVASGLEGVFMEYFKQYDANKLSSHVWKKRIASELAKLEKYEDDGSVYYYVRRICKLMLSPAYIMCIFHLKYVCAVMLRNSKKQKLYARKVRLHRRNRRVNCVYVVHKCIVHNIWSRLLIAYKTTWIKQAAWTEAQFMNIIKSF